jgi:hypothetical protein
MIEIQLFGWLLATLPSATSLVLLLVSLTSVTYLSMTLAPVMRAGIAGQRGARSLGVTTAVLTFGLCLWGARVGAPGRGGEMVPTLALAVAAAAASGASVALAWLGAGDARSRLGAAESQRLVALHGARDRERLRLEASQRAFFSGDDLRAEVAAAEAALGRLGALLRQLDATRADVEGRLAALGDDPEGLGRELRRTRDEIATRLDLGRRIHAAASAAAFRLACTFPIRLLLRRRPRDLTRGLDPSAEGAVATARVGAAVAAIDEFLREAMAARGALASLESRRPPPEGPADDAWALAMRDLASIEDAYASVQQRLRMVAVRLGARADMAAVAAAAGEVVGTARAGGIPAGDLQGLVDEVTRAESAVRMATPPELDARALENALARSAVALDGNDGASLDELLRALREVA